ncbi:MAG: hypothetical protein CME62_16680 [Halobacteriovoraceae bacterium]|nr:hypothetical protein [Halobacteriovoraceae bacterium]|tara:strand:- start:20585 stop:21214 length:630 start_codon:yes stop_codon:yes gene_type:complete
MLGPIGADIMSIFRLLSPSEIDRYMEYEEDQEASVTPAAMASGGEEFSFQQKSAYKQSKHSEEHQAKIIPLHQDDHQQSSQDNLPDDEHPSDSRPSLSELEAKVENLKNNLKANGLESVGILSAASLRNIEKKRLAEESKNKDSTTAFLIKEREKMRQSKRRIIEQHAFKTYIASAACEIYEVDDSADDDEETLDASGTKGILVNKKQF